MATTEAEYRARWDENIRTGTAPPLHHRIMGLQLAQLKPTTVLRMELTDDVRGPAPGTIHGGMLASLADVASAASLWESVDYGTELPVTTDMHVRYYRQPRSGPLTAEATVVHRGRRLLSTECVVTDAEQRVLTRTTATYMVVPFGG